MCLWKQNPAFSLPAVEEESSTDEYLPPYYQVKCTFIEETSASLLTALKWTISEMKKHLIITTDYEV